jgi:7-cyano-7-deazaguanine synthase
MLTNHIMIYSGGMDSFTLLHWVMRKRAFPFQTADEAAAMRHQLFALSFFYGQRHSRELTAATLVCQKLNLRHQIINLAVLKELAKGSALTDDVPVPKGHYAEESMKKTIVPGRNTIMLSLALAFAEGRGPDDRAIIYYGAHAGDHHIYPDCRPEYIESVKKTIHLASDGRVSLEAPFQNMDKLAILREGAALGLSASAYADTYSCYEGAEQACGACGACVEGHEAFLAMGWNDPRLPSEKNAVSG